MKKNLLKVLLFFCFCILISPNISAQRLTGSITGIVTDLEGIVLPGVAVAISSPSMMGTRNYVTTETGAFRFPAVPPGTYKLTVELAGFKTTNRGDIVVRVGMTVSILIKMEQTMIDEEITVTAPSPMIDVKATKIGINIDNSMLDNLPMNRDLIDVINSVPGAVDMGENTTSVHGGSVRGNTYSFDGVNMNDPDQMTYFIPLNFDVIEEVEMITGAQPARIGFTEGVYVNVVTRSGGNKFSGGGTFFYTTDTMAQELWTDEQLQAMNKKKPVVDKNWIDGSFSLGGPVINDRVWFFTNVRRINREKRSAFEGPYADPFSAVTWEAFDWYARNWMVFGKLTTQITSKMKVTGMFNFTDNFQPSTSDPGPYTFLGATKKIDHDRTYTANGLITYLLNQNTYFDIRGSYLYNRYPQLLQEEVADMPYYSDFGTIWPATRAWGPNFVQTKKRLLISANITHFKDYLISASHEFKGGVEYENAYRKYDYWQKDNTVLFFRNGQPYIYPNYRGLFRFFIGGTEEGDSNMIDVANRFGLYIEDTATFSNRLTVSLGLRFDRSSAWKPAATLGQAGNPLSVWLGENLIRPYVAEKYPENFPDGINPFEAQSLPDWKGIVTWNNFSPRIGVNYDLFGDGRTSLKASYSRYTEYMMLVYISRIHPFSPGDFVFFWDDTDRDGVADTTDVWTLYPRDPRPMDIRYAQMQIDPDIKSPTNDEIIIGIEREFYKDFSLSINFVYKFKKNIFETVLYSPDTSEEWYNPNSPSGQNYWIPFNTIVPGDGDYPDIPVTVYYQKVESPDLFYRATNVPELYRKYRGVEISFNKRMSHGWQLAGSVIISKANGNIGAGSGETFGWSSAMDSANFFTNREGRIDIDRPLAIKLMGTVKIPYGFYLSAYYRHSSGSPWGRAVNVNAPTSWLSANNAIRYGHLVLIEELGTRRNEALDNLDMRVEKELSITGTLKVGAYIDILNVFGRKGIILGMNDMNLWFPVAENTTEGTGYVPSSYKKIVSIYGQRVFKLSLRFSF